MILYFKLKKLRNLRARLLQQNPKNKKLLNLNCCQMIGIAPIMALFESAEGGQPYKRILDENNE